jgi:hypothetical protein
MPNHRVVGVRRCRLLAMTNSRLVWDDAYFSVN